MSDLSGIRVLVTRPEHQADNLCRLIEHRGGQAVRLPTIKIVANSSSFKTDTDLIGNPFHWCIFISANAVNFALAAINGKIDQLNSAHIAAIGRATAKALELNGIAVDLVPEQGHDSGALLSMPPMRAVGGQRILIVRGSGGREELADVLRKRGAEVDCLEAYRRVIPDIDCTQVTELLARNRLDVITITSGEALLNLLAMLGEPCLDRLSALPLIVVSERIARIAADRGFKRILIADSPADASILETIIMCTTR
ncbi:MAG: uroporphyrinogen-III synthase [Gammaproteobacteria bacterium]